MTAPGDHALAAPLFVPLAGTLTAMVLPPRARAGIAVLACLATAGVDATLLVSALQEGPQVYRVGGWPAPFGIVLVFDLLGGSLATLSAVVATAASLHTLVAGDRGSERSLYHPFFLLLLAALGGVFLTGDLFNLYVFMELAILTSFPLVAMASRAVSAEVTFKYAVLAALGSTMLLAAIALTYAGAGTLAMADIAQLRGDPAAPAVWPVAGALMLAAFLLKAGILPFHFWLPDAHSAAPSAVSAMLSGVLVKVGVYGILRVTTLLFPDTPALAALVPLGAASAVFGGAAALANPDLKRLLAYSTISNVGLIVLAIGWGPAGVAAAFLHTINHALAKGSLFLSAGYVIGIADDEHRLERLGGVASLAPGAALAVGAGALAVSGLPPFGAFMSKLALLRAGLATDAPVGLLVIAATSALAIAYTVRAFVGVCWGEAPPEPQTRWRAPAGPHVPAGALALAVVALVVGLYPGPLVALATAVVAELHEPEIYIRAVFGRSP